MPGGNADCRKGSSLIIQCLDTGSQSKYTGDKDSRNYGRPMSSQRWTQIFVNNAEFVRAQPCAATQINNSDMLIFGGDSTKAFMFDTREVNS